MSRECERHGVPPPVTIDEKIAVVHQQLALEVAEPVVVEKRPAVKRRREAAPTNDSSDTDAEGAVGEFDPDGRRSTRAAPAVNYAALAGAVDDEGDDAAGAGAGAGAGPKRRTRGGAAAATRGARAPRARARASAAPRPRASSADEGFPARSRGSRGRGSRGPRGRTAARGATVIGEDDEAAAAYAAEADGDLVFEAADEGDGMDEVDDEDDGDAIDNDSDEDEDIGAFLSAVPPVRAGGGTSAPAAAGGAVNIFNVFAEAAELVGSGNEAHNAAGGRATRGARARGGAASGAAGSDAYLLNESGDETAPAAGGMGSTARRRARGSGAPDVSTAHSPSRLGGGGVGAGAGVTSFSPRSGTGGVGVSGVSGTPRRGVGGASPGGARMGGAATAADAVVGDEASGFAVSASSMLSGLRAASSLLSLQSPVPVGGALDEDGVARRRAAGLPGALTSSHAPAAAASADLTVGSSSVTRPGASSLSASALDRALVALDEHGAPSVEAHLSVGVGLGLAEGLLAGSAAGGGAGGNESASVPTMRDPAALRTLSSLFGSPARAAAAAGVELALGAPFASPAPAAAPPTPAQLRAALQSLHAVSRSADAGAVAVQAPPVTRLLFGAIPTATNGGASPTLPADGEGAGARIGAGARAPSNAGAASEAGALFATPQGMRRVPVGADSARSLAAALTPLANVSPSSAANFGVSSAVAPSSQSEAPTEAHPLSSAADLSAATNASTSAAFVVGVGFALGLTYTESLTASHAKALGAAVLSKAAPAGEAPGSAVTPDVPAGSALAAASPTFGATASDASLLDHIDNLSPMKLSREHVKLGASLRLGRAPQ